MVLSANNVGPSPPPGVFENGFGDAAGAGADGQHPRESGTTVDQGPQNFIPALDDDEKTMDVPRAPRINCTHIPAGLGDDWADQLNDFALPESGPPMRDSLGDDFWSEGCATARSSCSSECSPTPLSQP
eukprot:TRINITY_DN20168_c0_g1_i1.p3 TRINITY_DN20168_c0_g1~~TRINITY_DN20168_c0_g1_i1.p3  ORF type:complete len:129 (+),score=22.23 TRINITY_DN20168_c0_g1_i1:128-514(+)